MKITGAFAIEPGVEVLFGSRRLAYSDKPPGRAGVELLLDMLGVDAVYPKGFEGGDEV